MMDEKNEAGAVSSISRRLVIIGRNSQVWSDLEAYFTSSGVRSLGHADLNAAKFNEDEIGWILSYSRIPAENREIFAKLKAAGLRNAIYVSSATSNVATVTKCYSYPTAKAQAEKDARRDIGAKIVRFGVVYLDRKDLPGGPIAATSLEMIAEAIRSSQRGAPVPANLFVIKDTPFGSAAERAVYRWYSAAISRLSFPCLLRPVDLILRRLGWKWYGYVRLSTLKWQRDGF